MFACLKVLQYLQAQKDRKNLCGHENIWHKPKLLTKILKPQSFTS